MQIKFIMTSSAVPNLYVTDPNPHDVLLGRGSHLVKYEGNIEFRRLIHERKEEYISSVRHSQKDYIARDVISKVKSKNGRFLRKVDNPMEMKKYNIPANITSAWVHVDEGVVVEKIKQAFRDSCKEGSLSELHQSGEEAEESSKVPKPSGKSLKSESNIPSDSSRVAHAVGSSPVADKWQSKHKKELISEKAMEAVVSASRNTLGTAVHDLQQAPQDGRIVQLLLQHQQNQIQEQQRTLLDQLTVLGAANPSTTRDLDLASMRLDRSAYGSLLVPSQYRADDSNQLNVVNNMLVQQLQATALQRSLNAQLSQRRMAAAAEQSLLQHQADNLLPRTQLGIRPGDVDFLRSSLLPMSSIGHDQVDILRSLQEQRLLGQLSSANDLPLSHQQMLLSAPNSRLSDLAALSSQNRAMQAMLLSNERRSAPSAAGLDIMNQELLLRSAGASNPFHQYDGGISHMASSAQRGMDTSTESSASAARESTNTKRSADLGDHDKSDTSGKHPKKRKS
jgi:hypothetical protein